MSLQDKVAAFLDNAQGKIEAASEIASYFETSDLGARAQDALITALLALERKNPTVRFCLDGAGLQLMRTANGTRTGCGRS